MENSINNSFENPELPKVTQVSIVKVARTAECVSEETKKLIARFDKASADMAKAMAELEAVKEMTEGGDISDQETDKLFVRQNEAWLIYKKAEAELEAVKEINRYTFLSETGKAFRAFSTLYNAYVESYDEEPFDIIKEAADTLKTGKQHTDSKSDENMFVKLYNLRQAVFDDRVGTTVRTWEEAWQVMDDLASAAAYNPQNIIQKVEGAVASLPDKNQAKTIDPMAKTKN